MATSSQSTITLQQILDKIRAFGELRPILSEVSGHQLEPFITACTDTMNEIYGQPFPYKWNEIQIPYFYTNSWQQDYAIVDPGIAIGQNQSFYGLEWLERGIAINLSSSTVPKQWTYVETARQLGQATGAYINPWFLNPLFEVNSFPNYMLYWGTWGQGNVGGPTQGNNPTPGAIYTNPLGCLVTNATWSSASGGQAVFTLNYLPAGLSVGGILTVSNVYPTGYNGSWQIVNTSGPTVSPYVQPTITVTMVTNPGAYVYGGLIGGSNNVVAQPTVEGQPANPITQIIDPNGNYQVVVVYGTCGTVMPTWPAANAAFGTLTLDGTVVWTVVDPNAIGMRIGPGAVPSQTGVVWQFNLVGQKPAPNFSSPPVAYVNNPLSQTLAPFPDKYEPQFRAGVIAQCYRYSTVSATRDKGEKNWAIWKEQLIHLRAKQDRELEENQFVVDKTVFSCGTARNKYVGAAWPYNYPY